MVQFEGRMSLIHRKQRKPTGNGMKIYAICEPKTGYCFVFELDRRNGKKIEDFVLDNAAKLQPCHHHLYMDNLFTSTGLLKKLLERGIYGCGTARVNRGVPAALTQKEANLTTVGQWKWMMAPPQLLAVAWKDTGHTIMMSSFHKPEEGEVLR